MSRVDVYFNHMVMYNLEDMSVLGKLPKGSPELLNEHFKSMKEKYTIDIAMMGLNHPLRNAVYTVFPKSTIIIEPSDVRKMISYYLEDFKITNSVNQEIAAGLEDDLLDGYELGCDCIYNYHTKEEAIHYYRQWQADVPLGIEAFHHVITTIDYFYEEIFNYFELKDILGRKTDKIGQS